MRPTKVVTAATLRPVDLDTAKEHLRANRDSAGDYLEDEDNTLFIYLDGAIRACEHKLQTAIMDTRYEMYLTAWPGRCVSLDKFPVSAVNSVKYYDDDNVLQTVASGMYRVLDFMQPCVLEFDDDFDAPSLHSREYPIIINFNAGYTAQSSVPGVIRNGVLLELGERYERRTLGEALKEQPYTDHYMSPESMWV
jgi:uncharacterized phiE125 gp8 family phage protein